MLILMIQEYLEKLNKNVAQQFENDYNYIMESNNSCDRMTVLETFQVMYAIEMALSRIYSIFSVQFPEERTFWKTISSDEIMHGDNIKRIILLIADNDLKYKVGRSFSIKAGVLLLENIKLYISDAKEKLISKEKAFVIACELENYILETKYMDYLLTDNKEYKIFIGVIVKETAQHKSLIEKKFKDNCQQE